MQKTDILKEAEYCTASFLCMLGGYFLRSIRFNITEEDDGSRVDSFLRHRHGISGRVIIALKKLPDGMLKNGVHVRTVDLLHTGDVLEINLPEHQKRMPTCDTPVDILYEDNDVIVFNKPANMPVHQSGGHIFGTLDGVYAAHCQKSGNITPFRAINRLDKDTTGAVVVAKNQIAAGVLWKAVTKRYYCIVSGRFEQKQGTIDLPIEREFPVEMKRIVTPDGQQAITHYKVLAECKEASLVECILETGRTHQIRVHMSHMGHPLLGDEMYGTIHPHISRQALHCGKVFFSKPISNESVEIYAPFPPDFIHLMSVYSMSQSVDMPQELCDNSTIRNLQELSNL